MCKILRLEGARVLRQEELVAPDFVPPPHVVLVDDLQDDSD
jgi:hypothetical protein